jgi:probable rRNA maturation factor
MVGIAVADGRFKIEERRLKSLARSVLKKESAGKSKISIVYCSDRLIRDLTGRFMNRNRITDVLAFEVNDFDNGDFSGEIYVNVQQARRQAREYKVSYAEEVERLTVHGILHLLGYDDGNKKNRVDMWARQEGYLRKWKK